MNEDKPTHLDLFSGIGGFSLAAERAGFRTIGFSEIDPYASAVLCKHWPDVPNFGDIRKFTGGGIGCVDLITGGFPCQPFSVSGKQRGDCDERFLWPELVRVLGEVRPRFALLENVPGLLTIDGGRTFNRVMSDLVTLGYDCLWNLVPACAIGANHERDRLWIVANNNRFRKSQQTGSQQEFRDSPFDSSKKVANSKRFRQSSKRNRIQHDEKNEARKANLLGGQGENVSNSNDSGLCEQCRSQSISAEQSASECGVWWESEPNVGRVAHGIPKRVDRLRCLGNAIVPQVAEIFLKEIRKLI